MKKAFILIFLSLLVLSSLAMVSAGTVVMGKIYNADYSSTITGADVTVVCGSSEPWIGKSKTDGDYVASFSSSVCEIDDEITVSAVYGELHGEKNGIVKDGLLFDIPLDFDVVNVPLIPEFGLFIGALTMLGAVVAFFIIRKN